jgi:hypothetical protein
VPLKLTNGGTATRRARRSQLTSCHAADRAIRRSPTLPTRLGSSGSGECPLSLPARPRCLSPVGQGRTQESIPWPHRNHVRRQMGERIRHLIIVPAAAPQGPQGRSIRAWLIQPEYSAAPGRVGRGHHGIVDDSPQASWDFCLQVAQGIDHVCRGDDTWVPPILTALVTAVRATSLRRLHPFTSHAALSLSSGPRCWEQGAKTAPAFISLDPAGHYNVWSGHADVAGALACATSDPEHAAAELERLLAQWD